MTTTSPTPPQPQPMPNDPNRDLQCAVLDSGEIAVVRVSGRGCMQNSKALKEFGNRVQHNQPALKFIVDLCRCDSMDSTFLGVMATIAITQLRNNAPRMIVVNAGDQCERQMKKLGLTRLVDTRNGNMREIQRAEDNFVTPESAPVSRLDQICLTLEAHKELASLDETNEVLFQDVIEYLEESYKEESAKADDESKPTDDDEDGAPARV